MTAPYQALNATGILDLYFVENRSRLLDIAAFLDRVDRYAGADEARRDFRYRAFTEALKLLESPGGDRTKAIQMAFSDLSTEPLASAVGLAAAGAWKGTGSEGD